MNGILRQKINLIVSIAAKLGRRVDADQALKLTDHFSLDQLKQMIAACNRGSVVLK